VAAALAFCSSATSSSQRFASAACIVGIRRQPPLRTRGRVADWPTHLVGDETLRKVEVLLKLLLELDLLLFELQLVTLLGRGEQLLGLGLVLLARGLEQLDRLGLVLYPTSTPRVSHHR
jgi:hypothetical protein